MSRCEPAAVLRATESFLIALADLAAEVETGAPGAQLGNLNSRVVVAAGELEKAINPARLTIGENNAWGLAKDLTREQFRHPALVDLVQAFYIFTVVDGRFPPSWIGNDSPPDATRTMVPDKLACFRTAEVIRAMQDAVSRLKVSVGERAKSPANLITAKDRRLSVKATIDALHASGLWGVQPREIASRCRIPLKTIYRYLDHTEVQATWRRYKGESAGKVPANLRDLGDDAVFSFSDRD